LINLEIKLNNINAARFALSKGIIKYPQSGVLWAIAIALERKSNQHAKALDALTKCPDDPVIMTSIANLYFVDNDEMNAKKWYDSVIRECKEYGDAWLFYYKMIKESRIISGNDVSGDNKEDMLKELKVKVNESQPNKGILWKKIRKLNWENYYKRYDELLDIAVNIIDFNNIFDINE
jgi:pre-mRNA-processing factor 6